MSRRMPSCSSRVLPWGLAVLAVLATAGGCEKPELTYASWTSVEAGMSPVQVEELIGPPRHRYADYWEYDDAEPRTSARIYFTTDGTAVQCKRWYDPVHGWETDNPDSDPASAAN